MQYFSYGDAEIAGLKERDPLLGAAIDRLGRPKRPIIPDLFSALVNSIIAQQISAKAAETVWNRVLDAYGGEITPENVAKTDPLWIQKLGMSHRKAGYIRRVADTVLSGDLDIAGLPEMTDEEIIIAALVSLPGVGVWTAEMMLLHSLERPDVVSGRDLGIRRGMMRLYQLSSLSADEFAEYRRRYSPYGSVASIYLWEIAHENL